MRKRQKRRTILLHDTRLRRLVKARLAAMNTSQAALARQLGISATSLSQFLARENHSTNSLLRLAKALGLKVADLVE